MHECLILCFSSEKGSIDAERVVINVVVVLRFLI